MTHQKEERMLSLFYRLKMEFNNFPHHTVSIAKFVRQKALHICSLSSSPTSDKKREQQLFLNLYSLYKSEYKNLN
jgi:hypothetical protein